MDVFLRPRADAIEQARRIVAEGARFNIINRNVNTPFVALKFLRRANHPDRRSASPAAGPTVASSSFSPSVNARDRVSSPPRTAGRLAAPSLLIPVRAGSELVLETGGTTMTIRVSFKEDPKTMLWLPVAMSEHHWSCGGGAVEGSARCSNYRRFRVETSTEIGKN